MKMKTKRKHKEINYRVQSLIIEILVRNRLNWIF